MATFNFSDIEKLSKKDQGVLVYYALFNSVPRADRPLPRVIGLSDVSPSHFCYNETYFSIWAPGFKINPKKYLPVLCYAQKNYPVAFKSRFGKKSTDSDEDNLYKLVYYHAYSNWKAFYVGLNINPSVGLILKNPEYLWPFVMDWGASEILEGLNMDGFAPLLEKMFTTLALNDVTYKDTTVEKIIKRATETKAFTPLVQQKAEDLVALHRFYDSGEYVEPKDNDKIRRTGGDVVDRPYALILKASKMVYEGAYQSAVSLFEVAMKILNKENEIKNIFNNPISLYLYIAALAHNLDEPQKKKLRTLLNKKIWDRFGFCTLEAMVKGFLSDERKLDSYSLNHNLDRTNFDYYLTILFSRYFYYSGQQYQFDPGNPPDMDFYAAEVRDYFPNVGIDQKRREHLDEAFGKKGALTSIKKVSPWALALESVLSELEQQSAIVEAVQPENRIIYLVSYGNSYYNRVEISQQKWLKSGRWSAPRRVSAQAFCQKKVEGMNQEDSDVASRLGTNMYYDIYDTDIIPYLVGSDRVFTMAMEPVEIVSQEAQLVVKRLKDGSFQMETNLPPKALDTYAPYVLQRPEKTKYIVTELRKDIWDKLKKLTKFTVFPPEAEETLQEIVPKLAAHVKVDSDMLSQAAEIEGTAHIVLVLTPQPEGFYLQIAAQPYDKGSKKFYPGKGPADYYENIGKTTVHVVRRQQLETKRLEKLQQMYMDSCEQELIEDSDLTIEETLNLLEIISQHPEDYSIEWPAKHPLSIAKVKPGMTWEASLRREGGWFEVEGDVQLDNDTIVNIATLIANVGESHGRYVRLSEGQYVRLDHNLRQQLARIEAMAVKERNGLKIGDINAALLPDDVLNGELKIKIDKSLEKLRQKVKESDELNPKVPRNLKATLRDYQIEGYQWITRLDSWGAGACLADDMGLGKTLQAIAFMLHRSKEGPSLVVAPASVVPNWRNEIRRFAPSLDVQILNESKDRAKLIEEAKKGQIIVTTYGLLHTESESLTKKQWNVICLDEAHTIKNRTTAMSKAAMSLESQSRLILTGTPIQNRLSELWNLMRFINPSLLGSYEQFNHKFIQPIEGDNSKERRRQLQRLISPFILRRTKAEVASELPEKTEIMMEVELTKKELAIYETMRESVKKSLEMQKGEAVSVNTLAEITRLRQCADSVELIHPEIKETSSKTNTLLDLISQLDESSSMLVFSQFTSYLALVRQALEKENIPYLYLDGSTPIKKREELVEKFQNGECQIFIISLKAGGLGLNLTNANYVVHLDPWWNPAIQQQATDRSHRIGQKRNVTIYQLISHNTIEEKIMRLHEVKKELANDLLAGTSQAAKLTRSELLELLTPEDNDSLFQDDDTNQA